MKKYFIAHIYWKSFREGGRRKIPPEGTRYCPLLDFSCKNLNAQWSIDFICPNFEETDKIEFKFLVDDAPCELLEVGEFYDVREGGKVVAKIKLLDYDYK